MRNSLNTALVAGVFFASWCVPAAAIAQERPGRGSPPFSQGHLILSVRADGHVSATALIIAVRKPGKQTVPDERDWTQAMEHLLGGPVRVVSGHKSPNADAEDPFPVFQREFELVEELRRDGWVRYLEADPGPFVALLRQAGMRTLVLQILVEDKQGFCECTLPSPPRDTSRFPAFNRQDALSVDGIGRALRGGWFLGLQTDATIRRPEFYHFQFPLTDEPVPPFRVAYGYRPKDFVVLAPLALLPLPLLLTLWQRRRLLRRPEAARAAAWWGYSRFHRRLEVGLALGWAFAVMGTPAGLLLDRLAHQALGVAVPGLLFLGRDWLSLAVYTLPPAVTGFLCAYLSYGVYSRIRNLEWTRRDRAWHALAGHVVPWLNLFLYAALVTALLGGDGYRAVSWGMLAFLIAVAMPRLRPAERRQTLLPLDAGVVRDRVFELAQKAGVKVNQVYLSQTDRDPMANAAAVVGNKVLLTDYLLRNLSKRQVDFVVAHELVHLRHRHPGRLAVGGISIWVASWLLFLLTYYAQTVARRSPELQPTFEALAHLRYGLLLVIVLGGIWVRNFRMRGYEFVADGEAVAVAGGDAEVAIAALARLGQLNLHPDKWGRLDEALLTHPSNSRRIQALADENDIDPERLPDIVAAADRDEERYPLPADLVRDERVFFTECKRRRVSAIQWTAMGLFMLFPALLALAFDALSPSGPAAWAAVGGGIVLALILPRVLFGYTAIWGERRLRAQLCGKWKGAGLDVDRPEALFVGLAPARVPRLFEGSFDWDVGFLIPAGDRLCYVGCQTSFALARKQVKEVRLGPGAPRWGKSQRVYLTWTDDAGVETTWNLRPAGAAHVRSMQRQVPQLLRSLQEWVRGEQPATPPPEPLSSLRAPAFGKVTFATVASFLRANPLGRLLYHNALTPVGLAILFGCSFALTPLPGWGWYAPALSCLMVVHQRIPFWLYREPRLPKQAAAQPTGIVRAG